MLFIVDGTRSVVGSFIFRSFDSINESEVVKWVVLY